MVPWDTGLTAAEMSGLLMVGPRVSEFTCAERCRGPGRVATRDCAAGGEDSPAIYGLHIGFEEEHLDDMKTRAALRENPSHIPDHPPFKTHAIPQASAIPSRIA